MKASRVSHRCLVLGIRGVMLLDELGGGYLTLRDEKVFAGHRSIELNNI